MNRCSAFAGEREDKPHQEYENDCTMEMLNTLAVATNYTGRYDYGSDVLEKWPCTLLW